MEPATLWRHYSSGLTYEILRDDTVLEDFSNPGVSRERAVVYQQVFKGGARGQVYVLSFAQFHELVPSLKSDLLVPRFSPVQE